MKIFTAQHPEMLTVPNGLIFIHSLLCLPPERRMTDPAGVSMEGLSG